MSSIHWPWTYTQCILRVRRLEGGKICHIRSLLQLTAWGCPSTSSNLSSIWPILLNLYPLALLKLRALQPHPTSISQNELTAAQQEAAPEASQEAPWNGWLSLSNLYSVPSLRQSSPQHKFFYKLLKLSFISSIPKDLSSLILFFKSVTLIAIVVFACLELIFSLESKCFNVTFLIGLHCLQSTWNNL